METLGGLQKGGTWKGGWQQEGNVGDGDTLRREGGGGGAGDRKGV